MRMSPYMHRVVATDRTVSIHGVVSTRRLVFALLAVACLAVACAREERAETATRARGQTRDPLGRVIVVGFDGIDPDMVKRWATEGMLPNFSKLLRDGAFGELVTVLPPASAPAWTSAVTGVSPGKHGIYGFFKEIQPDLAAPRIFNTSEDRGFSPVWEILSTYGRRSYIVNIPLTSPADSLNGLMISGFPYSSEDSRAHYWPDSLGRHLGDYMFDPFSIPFGKQKEEAFFGQVETIAAKRLELGLRLLEADDWDLFWIVFTFTDRYQHYLWKYMDEDHPLYDPLGGNLYGDRIKAAYIRADAFLSEFMGRMREGDLLIVMSDHGFGHLYYPVNATNFLYRTLGPASDAVAPAADMFGGKFRIVASGPNAEERYLGIRRRLVAALRDLKDPERGVPIVDSIYVKEDIYEGPYLASAPDVICLERPGYLFFAMGLTPDLRLLDRGAEPDKGFSGFHTRHGTIGLYGHEIRAGETVEARIIDIAPTLLTYLGVPAPTDMDGTIPAGAFTDDASGRMTLTRSGDRGYRSPTGRRGQDTKHMEKQLRALGYIQ